MKKNILSLSILGIGAIVGTQAFAADDFDGAYIGGKLGANHSSTSGVLTTGNATTTTLGAELGYNWQFDNFLLGLDAFYDANSKTDHSAALGMNPNYGSNDAGADLKLGIPYGNILPYAKLGYGHTSGTGDASSYGKSAFHGGLGIEFKVAPHWSLAGEWTNTRPSDDGTRFTSNNLTFNVNYYFGHEAAPMPAPAPAPVAVAAPEPAPAPAPAPKVEKCTTTVDTKPVTLDGANFATNKATLKPSAAGKLQPVLDFVAKNPNTNLEVSGFTDNTGKKPYNEKLSLRRADAVKAYLVKHGLAADHIAVKGFGPDQPVADNGTEAGRAQNRRVEVHYNVSEEKKNCVME